MKIGGNEQIKNTSLNPSIEAKNNSQNDVRIGDYLVQNSEGGIEAHSLKGKSAEVTLSQKVQKSLMPGFTKQNISIKTAGGVEFNITLHVQASTDKEQVQSITEKLCRVFSNLPPQVLDDMKEELRHVTICPNIVHNKDAIALAISELNQVFLSAERLSTLSDKEVEETLIHEIGHLIDRREGTFEGKWSQYCQKNFEALKSVATPELGFEKDSYTMSNTSECFADFYLYKCGAPSENHRGRQFFERLDNYLNDVSTLSKEELQVKYGDNTNSIIDVAEKWKAFYSEFNFILTGTQSGKYPRLLEVVEPLSIEQMLEINAKSLQEQKIEDN